MNPKDKTNRLTLISMFVIVLWLHKIPVCAVLLTCLVYILLKREEIQEKSI